MRGERLHLSCNSPSDWPQIERDWSDVPYMPDLLVNPVSLKKRMIMIQNILDRKGAKVFTIRATDTVQSAADRMHEHDIAALVVKSGDAIKGVISERDIVRAVSRHGGGALSLAVLDVATHAMVTVSPRDSLKRAMGLMTDHRVRHLPVIAKGILVGIVSIGDVVKVRLEDLETEANVLRDAYIAAR
jgi:CBS domain-containing protein